MWGHTAIHTVFMGSGQCALVWDRIIWGHPTFSFQQTALGFVCLLGSWVCLTYSSKDKPALRSNRKRHSYGK